MKKIEKKKNIESDIESKVLEFFRDWGSHKLTAFLRDIIPLFEVFDVNDDEDWLSTDLTEEERNIRLIRTVYLISRIAENHASSLVNVKVKFKDLYRKMEGAYER